MNPHLPSGLRRGIPFLVQDDWTPEQACAVVELLDDLREVIYRRYQMQIQQYLQHDRAGVTTSSNGTPADKEPF